MKKLISLMLLGTLAAPCFGAKVVPIDPVKEPERYKAMMKKREAHLRRTGGLVHTGTKGRIAYVNCQDKVSDEAMKDVANLFTKNLRADFFVAEKPMKFELAKAMDAVEKSGGNAAIFLVDDPSLPMSLVAMESKWALVNVHPIVQDKPDADKLKERQQKLLLRVSTVLLGGATSDLQISAMQSISSLEDLDRSKGKGVDPKSGIAMMRHLPTIGVLQDKMTSYRKACQEGWAPAPTNEYQKAVWEQERGTKK